MLLPRDPALDEGQSADDPRKELVERLLEHERYKNAAEMLQEKRLVEEAMWSNPQIKQFLSDEDDPGLSVTLFDLIKTLQEVLERVKNRPIYRIDQDDVTVPVMIERLADWMRQTDTAEGLSIVRLFEQQRSRRAMICLFLAVLEMVRMQAVVLAQKDLFGDIAIKRHKRFEEALTAKSVAEVEEEYK
jgi:segregation and condensation protein A